MLLQGHRKRRTVRSPGPSSRGKPRTEKSSGAHWRGTRGRRHSARTQPETRWISTTRFSSTACKGVCEWDTDFKAIISAGINEKIHISTILVHFSNLGPRFVTDAWSNQKFWLQIRSLIKGKKIQDVSHNSKAATIYNLQVPKPPDKKDCQLKAQILPWRAHKK